MAKGRWNGEWLVAVDDQGRVMLPTSDPTAPPPTHYRVTFNYGRDGTLLLTPMKVASAEDLRPQQVEEQATATPTDTYSDEERAALSILCPYCNAGPGKGCFAQPSGRLLTEYPENPQMHQERLSYYRMTRNQ